MPRHVLGAVLRAAAGPALPIGIAVLLSATIGGTMVAAGYLMPKAGPPMGTSTLALSPSPAAGAPAEAVAAAGNRQLRRLPGLGPSAPDAARPPGPQGHISIPSVGLSVAVVDYRDCSGDTPMTRTAAVHFLCTPDAVTALVGHNPGVFTPLLGTHPGDAILYRTESGTDLAYHLRGDPVQVSPSEATAAALDQSFTHMVLTTCAAPDSSSYWVFIAVPDTNSSSDQGSTAAAPNNPPQKPPRPAPSPAPTHNLLGGLGL